MKRPLILWFGIFVGVLLQNGQVDAAWERQKRFLLFPRQAPTRYQFIAGIGIPVDLAYESLTTGYVLKAMYWLPYNSSVFRENAFFPEYQEELQAVSREMKKLIYTPSALRWEIYTFLIDRMNSAGYNGKECILKTICEENAIPFERYHHFTAELIHILFSPSSSRNAKCDDEPDYKMAEQQGKSDGDCDIYNCSISLLNIISKLF